MGPLAGIRVVELASLGPGPFCAMVLADLGADVVRIERPGGADRTLGRSRPVVTADLKTERGVRFVLRLVESADVLVEGFRPGVTERLGVGPEACHALNPRLVYGRMTGWGQQGPLAQAAGHDINYIAMAGTLGAIGVDGSPPTPPLNLLGDFGGGGLLLALGVLAALLERGTSGSGQVVDAAMVDGAALLATMVHEMIASGTWSSERGSNLLDGGAPFYAVYATADAGWMSVGALEPQFFAALVDVLEVDFPLDRQYDPAAWPELTSKLEAAFAAKTRDEWEEAFVGSDACCVPVLTPLEAQHHPANDARGVFVDVGGATVPGPAPRFSRSRPPDPSPGGGRADLTAWGFSDAEIAELADEGIA